jgi:hypothetical protein
MSLIYDIFLKKEDINTDKDTITSLPVQSNNSIIGGFILPPMIPLGKSVGDSDIIVRCYSDDDKLTFNFKTNLLDNSAVGVKPWEKSGVELYFVNTDNIEIFYQVIISNQNEVTFYKHEGGLWSNVTPDGYRVISRTPQNFLKWSGDGVNVRVGEDIEIIIDYKNLSIPIEKLAFQVIHNIDGGKNRFVSSLHPITKHEQDRRGWKKFIE